MIRDAEFDFVEHGDYNFNIIRSQASNVRDILSYKESVLLEKLEVKLHSEIIFIVSLKFNWIWLKQINF